jgi:hypothetical protein
MVRETSLNAERAKRPATINTATNTPNPSQSRARIVFIPTNEAGFIEAK